MIQYDTIFFVVSVWSTFLCFIYADKLLFFITSSITLLHRILLTIFAITSIYYIRHVIAIGKTDDLVINIFSGFVTAVILAAAIYKIEQRLDLQRRKRSAKYTLEKSFPIAEYSYTILTLTTQRMLTSLPQQSQDFKYFSFRDIEFAFQPSLVVLRKFGEEAYVYYFDVLRTFISTLSNLSEKIDPDTFSELYDDIIALISFYNVQHTDVVHALKTARQDDRLFQYILETIRSSAEETPPMSEHPNIITGMIVSYQFIRAINNASYEIINKWKQLADQNEEILKLTFK